MQKPSMEKRLSDLKQQNLASLARLAEAAGGAGPSNPQPEQQRPWYENAYRNHAGNPFGYREPDSPEDSDDEGPGGENPTLRPGDQVGQSDNDNDGSADDDATSNSMDDFVVSEEEVAEEERAAEKEVELEEEWEISKRKKGRKTGRKGKKKAGSGGGGGDGDGGGSSPDEGDDGGAGGDEAGQDGDQEDGADSILATAHDELTLGRFAHNGKEEEVLPCYLEYLLRAALDPNWAQVRLGMSIHSTN
jgi:hypothetical protein